MKELIKIKEDISDKYFKKYNFISIGISRDEIGDFISIKTNEIDIPELEKILSQYNIRIKLEYSGVIIIQ